MSRRGSLRRKKGILFGDMKYKSCAYCEKILSFTTATVDHIIPRSKNGSDNINNLTISCSYCNNEKGARCLI